MSEDKVVVKKTDMTEEMQKCVFAIAFEAVKTCGSQADMVRHIKSAMDERYNPDWHCFVGRNFGCFVTHETTHFIYLYVGQIAVLLFRTG